MPTITETLSLIDGLQILARLNQLPPNEFGKFVSFLEKQGMKPGFLLTAKSGLTLLEQAINPPKVTCCAGIELEDGQVCPICHDKP